jgi:hypothetical protein
MDNETLYDLTRAETLPTVFVVLFLFGLGTLLMTAYIIWYTKTCKVTAATSTSQSGGTKPQIKPYRRGASAPRLYRMTERGAMLGDSNRNKKSYAPASV